MKTPAYLFFTIGICLICYGSFSQGWEKSFGGDKDEVAYDVIQTTDGGYVAVGSTMSFGAGGNDVFIVKINSNGILKWTKVIGGPGNDIAYSVTESSTGDLLVAGVTNSYGVGGNDVYVIKLTANGGLKWTKTFGGTGNDEARTVRLKGNQIYIAGTTILAGTGNSNFYLIKTDNNGNLLWEKNYGSAMVEAASSMTNTFDGGFAITGYSNISGNDRTYMIKVNANGDTLFTKFFNLYAQPTGIIETADHGLAMIGYANNGTFILKVSSTGNILFSSNNIYDYSTGFVELTNGDFIACGIDCISGCYMTMDKYDSTGTMLWKKAYQLPNYAQYFSTNACGNAIKKINGSNSVVACGYTELPYGSNSDFLILKADTAGISYPPVSLTANGPTTFCAPGSVKLTAPQGYTSYQWTYVPPSSPLVYIPGTNARSYTATETGSYSCIMKSASNDVNISIVYVNERPASAPVITSTDPASFCAVEGESTTMFVNPKTGFTFQWKINGLNIPGATGIGWSTAISGNYSVTATNVCGTYNSQPFVVNGTSPPQAPVITSDAYLQAIECNGFIQSYSGYVKVPYGSAPGYQWYHNGILWPGANSHYVSPYFNNENYTCAVSNSCGSVTTSPFFVTFDTFQVISALPWVSGPTQGCGVSGVTLSLPYFQGPLEWNLNGSPIPGANDDSCFATISGTYHCTYYDYDCGALQSQPIQVFISQDSAAAISPAGPASVCSGTVTLNATPTGAGNTYQWYKNNVIISGALTASYVANASGNYMCRINQPSCGFSTSGSLFISIGLPINNTITASATTICSGSTSILNVVSPAPGQTFQWKRNGGVIAGATSASFIASQAGNYICKITNSCGTITSNSITVNVHQAPAPAISGNTLICPGSNVTLTSTGGTGVSYLWYSGNYAIIGATMQSYTATATAAYRVKVTAANGCTAFSNTISTTPGSLPVASVSLSGFPVICNNEFISLKTPSGNGYSYQWKRNGNMIPGATDSIYSASDSGNYSVTVNNICGTTVSASPYNIQLKSLPTATITPQGPTTFCAGGSVLLNANTGTGSGQTYSWKKNGSNISGAYSSSYTATVAGTYKVTVTNSSGCSKTSPGILVSVPCRDGRSQPALPTEDINAMLYPNPYSDNFILLIDDEVYKKYKVIIMDVTGKVVGIEEEVIPGKEIQLGEKLDAGCYFVNVISADQKKILKVIKM